jgi:hypothetical protein
VCACVRVCACVSVCLCVVGGGVEVFVRPDFLAKPHAMI